MEIAGLIPSDRKVDGVVEMLLDATRKFAALFPTGYSGVHKIVVGDRRDDSDGPMQVVSGPEDGFEGKLTSSKCAKLTKVSQDTATRDIKDLIDKGMLHQDSGGGRSTSYSIALENVR